MTEMAVPGTLKVKVAGVSVPVPFYSMPPGVMAMWPASVGVIPGGWLLCDGRSIPVASQPSLHAVIGYQFGGAGANFNLPDMRVRLPMGAGAGKALGASDGLPEASRAANHNHAHGHAGSTASSTSSTTVAIAGAYTGTYVSNTNTDHNHVLSASDHGVATNTPTTGGANRATGGAHGSSGMAVQNAEHGHTMNDPTHGHANSTGATTTTTTVTIASGTSTDHPYLALNYIIKV